MIIKFIVTVSFYCDNLVKEVDRCMWKECHNRIEKCLYQQQKTWKVIRNWNLECCDKSTTFLTVVIFKCHYTTHHNIHE